MLWISDQQDWGLNTGNQLARGWLAHSLPLRSSRHCQGLDTLECEEHEDGIGDEADG